MHKLRSISLTAALALAAAVCAKSDRITTNPGVNATRTVLTDAPFPYDRVARIDLFIVGVSASLSSDTGSTARS